MLGRAAVALWLAVALSTAHALMLQPAHATLLALTAPWHPSTPSPAAWRSADRGREVAVVSLCMLSGLPVPTYAEYRAQLDKSSGPIPPSPPPLWPTPEAADWADVSGTIEVSELGYALCPSAAAAGTTAETFAGAAASMATNAISRAANAGTATWVAVATNAVAAAATTAATSAAKAAAIAAAAATTVAVEAAAVTATTAATAATVTAATAATAAASTAATAATAAASTATSTAATVAANVAATAAAPAASAAVAAAAAATAVALEAAAAAAAPAAAAAVAAAAVAAAPAATAAAAGVWSHWRTAIGTNSKPWFRPESEPCTLTRALHLRQVWRLADRDGDEQVDLHEYLLACHLATRHLKHRRGLGLGPGLVVGAWDSG